MYTIRLATAADAATITRHRRRMFEDMGDADYIQSTTIDASYHAWVGQRLEDGRYVGWLMTGANGAVMGGAGVEIRERAPHPLGLATRYAYIVNVYVEPDYRRKGIARTLLQTILDWCAQENLNIIALHASDSGRPLYESLGFTASTEMRLIQRE